MDEDFNKHLGNVLRMRRLALGLTQTKVAKAINVTFQQIQKYEKGINGVSSTRLLQLSNYLKVPISYFYDNYAEYSGNMNKTVQEYMSVNYAFLAKIYSEMTQEQKSKFQKMTAKEVDFANIKTGWILAPWGFKNIALYAGNIAYTSKVYTTQNIGGRISLLYLDVDNYEGTMAVLKNLYPILTKGGVVAFDDYYNHNHGEHIAVDEFFKDKKVNIKSFPWERDNSSTAYFIKNNEQKS